MVTRATTRVVTKKLSALKKRRKKMGAQFKKDL